MQIPTEHEANVFGQLDTYAKKIERSDRGRSAHPEGAV